MAVNDLTVYKSLVYCIIQKTGLTCIVRYTSNMNRDTTEYIQRQLALGRQRLRKYIASPNGRVYPQRYIFIKTKQYLDIFLRTKAGKRWVIIPGLRGTGKTTILAQSHNYLYKEYGENINLIYFSLNEAVETLGSDLVDVLNEYERLLGESYEVLTKPTFILIDEVQSDPKWAPVLKALVDRTEKVFLVCTGSSAVHLQDTADVTGRRAVMERMYPMSFCEFEMVKNDVYPDKGLKKLILDALYNSRDAEECYARLSSLRLRVDQYWAKVDRSHWRYYLAAGSLPFVLTERSYADISDAILSNMDKVITKDLLQIGKFTQDTVPAIKRLLYILAESDAVSDNKLSEILKITRVTLNNIYDALVKAEVLIRIPPNGQQTTASKKPSKYLFMSPAIRSSLFYIAGSSDTASTREGRLLEDVTGLHFYRTFGALRHGEVVYDSTKGSADFLYKDGVSQIAIEVGKGLKDARQVNATMKRLKCRYGLTISVQPLMLSSDKQSVMVPWDFFALT